MSTLQKLRDVLSDNALQECLRQTNFLTQSSTSSPVMGKQCCASWVMPVDKFGSPFEVRVYLNGRCRVYDKDMCLIASGSVQAGKRIDGGNWLDGEGAVVDMEDDGQGKWPSNSSGHLVDLDQYDLELSKA